MCHVIGFKPVEKLAVSKATVPQLMQHLQRLHAQEQTREQKELFEIIQMPGVMVGKSVSHTWNVEGQDVVYSGTVLEHVVASDEFQILCDGETDPYYIIQSELVADVVRGDLEVKK